MCNPVVSFRPGKRSKERQKPAIGLRHKCESQFCGKIVSISSLWLRRLVGLLLFIPPCS